MKILYINSDYYDYDKSIARRLRELGNTVDEMAYIGTPSFLRIYYSYLTGVDAKGESNRRIQCRELKRIFRTGIKYDAVFVTSGQELIPETLKELHQAFPRAVFAWYLWDNISNINTFGKLREYYDTIISFDKEEADREGFLYLPDFYIYGMGDDKCNVHESWKKEYDLSYVGMYTESRYLFVTELLKTNTQITPFVYFYRKKPGGVRALLSRIVDFLKNKEENPYINDKKLSYDEMISIVKKSKAILDIASPNQTGLSMRPYEALAFNVKVITTNETILKMDFYNKGNAVILDKDNPLLPNVDFFMSDYKTVPKEIVEEYSLNHWCSSVLDMLNSFVS